MTSFPKCLYTSPALDNFVLKPTGKIYAETSTTRHVMKDISKESGMLGFIRAGLGLSKVLRVSAPWPKTSSKPL